MKVLIVSGGTGSVELKKGLSKYIPFVNLYTLVNAYDNGKSTGLIRKVFDGNILGPSDVRKQQFLDYQLYRNEIKTEESEKIFNILNKRYSFYKNPEKEIKELIKDFPNELIEAVNVYFEQPLARKIRYDDFSLANIIYGGLAYLNNYSLQKAADIMAKYLNLPNNIIVTDDTSLFLCAKTENNYIIYDEGKIVEWNNPNNRIVDIFFIDKYGNEKQPILSERAKKIIKDSDLIVLSAGTQFSSLIPTYKTKGFNESIKNKEVYLIMNVSTDKDMKGYSKKEQFEIISKYVKFDKVFSDIHLNVDNEIVCNFKSEYYENKHDGNLLAYKILEEYFKEKGLNPKKLQTLMIDYDDTLMSRNINDIEISLKVIELVEKLPIETILVTGKDINEIKGKFNYYFCNYANTVYDYKRNIILKLNVIKDQNKIFNALKRVKFNFSKYENRADSVISLRFLDDDYREVLYNYLIELFKDEIEKNEIYIRKAGVSTIDIMSKMTNKYENIKQIKNKIYLNLDKTIYIADEKDGNDKEMFENMTCLEVKSPYDTYTILKFIDNSIL